MHAVQQTEQMPGFQFPALYDLLSTTACGRKTNPFFVPPNRNGVEVQNEGLAKWLKLRFGKYQLRGWGFVGRKGFLVGQEHERQELS